MPGLSAATLDAIRPYLESEEPNDVDELYFYCPLHDDVTKRSASVNVKTGAFFCFGCDAKGNLRDLAKIIRDGKAKNPPPSRNGQKTGGGKKAGTNGSGEAISEGKVAGFASALLSSGEPLVQFRKKRGLTNDTIKEFQLGWDRTSSAYTIPVRDQNGTLLNIRKYQPDAPDSRSKFWSIGGHGSPVLYPAQTISDLGSVVIICEGELDALLTIQNGFEAVTRTGGAKVWHTEWNKFFKGKTVFIIHDMDTVGQTANKRVYESLKEIAKCIIVPLPYETTEKHGKDLTDYWLDGHTADEFQLMLQLALSSEIPESRVTGEVLPVTIKESFNPFLANKQLTMKVAITGKKIPSYHLPKRVSFSCVPGNAGVKCALCPMNKDGHNGKYEITIDGDDRMILELVNATDQQVQERLRVQIGAVKCGVMKVEALDFQSVEELFVRTSVEEVDPNNDEDSYITRKVYSVGRHDSMANTIVQVTGGIYSSPRNQESIFQAWEVIPTKASMDAFELTDHVRSLLERFSPGNRSPLEKLAQISKQLAKHVTGINGRPEMHAFIDLVFHSVLSFYFDGQLESRGWLDAIIVGDTRTGKSAAAKSLIAHYGAGEIISCEAATFAGVVGGMQQLGGKDWVVTWGAVPLNDRRAVVLDELSGLTTEQISQMSSIRSSGVAELTKIQHERAWARTRLLWMGNPRNARMEDYTYGVQAIQPLVGNNEDIARFDIAMSVAEGEVPEEEINRQNEVSTVGLRYTAEACRARLMWAWSRRPDQIVWTENTEKFVYAQAIEMGKRYVARPPLVQSANVRIKIARVAAALAAATYSTSDNGETLIVGEEHVEDAIKFMDHLYSMPGFGYREISKRVVENKTKARSSRGAALDYFRSRPDLVTFLAGVDMGFRHDDLESVLNMERSEANSTINLLWGMNLLEREKSLLRLSSECHSIVRELEGKDREDW